MEPVNQYLISRNDWVKVAGPRHQCVTQVREIHTDGIVTTHGGAVLWEEVFGIELTAEWLEVAGFNEFGYDIFGRRDFACAVIADGSFIVEVNGAQIAVLRFVHELQQLYGAIKQRKLVIPLPAPNA